MSTADLIIHVGREEVAPFVTAAISHADLNKDALGFFPEGVFHEFAAREQLFIATTTVKNGDPQYAGHILFDCKYPSCSILQVNVSDHQRRMGIGRALIRTLRDHLAPVGFTSMTARVAEDLAEANHFYQSEGFYVQRVLRGGASRGRIILRRVLELATPQLFAPSGITDTDPLGLKSTLPVDRPVFLLDLNVIRDIGPRRPRNAVVVDLFKGEKRGLYLLGVSSEARAELKRTAKERTDPLQDFVRVFPEFLLPDTDDIRALCMTLRNVIFPGLRDEVALTPQQRSDLRHVATVIHHRLTGLVTSDEEILTGSHSLENQFGIKIVSPAALAASLQETSDIPGVALGPAYPCT